MKAHSTSKATITGAFLFATFVIHVNGSHVRDTNVCKYSDMLVNILKRKSDHLYNCSSVKVNILLACLDRSVIEARVDRSMKRIQKKNNAKNKFARNDSSR